MTKTCQHPDAAGYQVADPRSGHPLCSHSTAEEAIACASSSNRLRALKPGERVADVLLFVRMTPSKACGACGHTKAA